VLNRLEDVGLALLALLTVVLVGVALWHESTVDSTSAPRDLATAGPTSTATSQPSEAPPEAELPDAWLVGLGGDSLLVRAPRVDCTVGADDVVLVSQADRGEAPVVTEVPGLLSVSGISVGDPGEARVVGSDADCAEVAFATTDGGSTWSRDPAATRSWSVLPGEERRLASPAGTVDVPCTPATVSGIDAEVARVWCEDGRILGTSSGGDAWKATGRRADAQAVLFLSPGTGFALVEQPSCDGVAILGTTDGGKTWPDTTCSSLAGPWGLAGAGSSLVLAGGDAVDVSADSGRTWTRS
jgi:photosystem II stability/assembly factor-like uncharacterized protein